VNATVELSVQVDGEGFETSYERTVQTNATGGYSVTVPYPGTYTVGEETIRVSEAAVVEGETV